MGSDHHHHHHHHRPDIVRNIGIALALNFGFALVELVGGYLTGSVAILTDALHDFGDSLSLGLAFGLERMANKQGNKTFSYGYRRLSLLSALVTGAILITGSMWILSQAIPRLFDPVQPRAEGMILLALLGVIVNGFAAWKVMQGSSMNERTISWHMIEDVFGWVAVLVGSVIMVFWDLPIIDPLLSVVFTLFILNGVGRTFFHTWKLFLQASPKGLDLERLELEIKKLPHVCGLHDVHVWSLDGESHVMTMHAVVDNQVTMDEAATIKDGVRTLLSAYGRFHLTLEIESTLEECPDFNCVKN